MTLKYTSLAWTEQSRYRTFALMFKVLFSVGVLSIPSVFSYVGAVPGTMLVVGWGAFNTYASFLLGAFRLRHPGMHVSFLSRQYTTLLIRQGLQDMAYLAGGPIYREIVGILYVVG